MPLSEKSGSENPCSVPWILSPLLSASQVFLSYLYLLLLRIAPYPTAIVSLALATRLLNLQGFVVS